MELDALDYTMAALNSAKGFYFVLIMIRFYSTLSKTKASLYKSLIPSRRGAKPTEKFPNSLYTRIEEELKRPGSERNLSALLETPKAAALARDYGCIPSQKIEKRAKSKLKSSIKKQLKELRFTTRSFEQDVEYLQPRRLRSHQAPHPLLSKELEESENEKDSVEVSGVSPRVHRLHDQVLQLSSMFLSTLLPRYSYGRVQREDILLTQIERLNVKEFNDLSGVVLYWRPSGFKRSDGLQVDRRLLEQTLERIKKPLRWEITDKLSYLRNSPEIVFKYDEDSDCRKDQ